MKKLLLACLAVAATAQASAATGTCVALTDPAGDQQLPAPAPMSAAIDLLAAGVVATADDVTAVWTLSGAPVVPVGAASLDYTVGFVSATGTVYHLSAQVTEIEAPVVMQDDPFELSYDEAQVDGQGQHVVVSRSVPVNGSVDTVNNRVTITAPASAFGLASLAGESWTVIRVQSGFGAVGPTYTGADEIEVSAALVPGDGTC